MSKIGSIFFISLSIYIIKVPIIDISKGYTSKYIERLWSSITYSLPTPIDTSKGLLKALAIGYLIILNYFTFRGCNYPKRDYM